MSEPVALWKQALVSAAILAAGIGVWQFPDEALALLRLGRPETPMAVERGRGGGQAIPVIVAPVLAARDDVTIEVIGSGRAARSVTLRTEASGKIEALAIEPGARFSAGDVLMRLEDEEERLRLRLAETRLEEARRILERVTSLQGRGVAPDARLDEASTAEAIAALEVDSARKALDDLVLRAPFDGVTGLASLEVGDWVDNSVDIASFDDRASLLVEFDVPEAVLSRVTPGLAVTATTPAVPRRTFEGRVVAVDSRVAVASRTARVRVEIPNDDDVLRPGSSFSVRLDLPGETYPSVPELALQFSRDELHVWRVTGAEAERVAVRLVQRRAARVLVEGPLEPGDVVVVEGTQRLRPGRPIRVTGERAEGAA